MTSTVLEREAVVPARGRRDLRRGLRQLALAGAVPLVTLTAAWYGHHWWTVGRFIETTDDAYVGGDITVIAPKVAGFIGEVAIADNQAVHAGDLLVKLDDRDYRAALDRATAAVAAQRAALANLDATRQRLHEGFSSAPAMTAFSAYDDRLRSRRGHGRGADGNAGEPAVPGPSRRRSGAPDDGGGAGPAILESAAPVRTAPAVAARRPCSVIWAPPR